ncbi:hypothetical protein HaLaN_12715 [Haematococcus lacustris]|uniref:Uncharacterized protein n=1 Tax=Haematococcus lacustris TaxID=44745 RepID=A0A699Z2N6_HAELA|nr:hypothetical protein HaLaN_12715 [Haematococcus lacustris]
MTDLWQLILRPYVPCPPSIQAQASQVQAAEPSVSQGMAVSPLGVTRPARQGSPDHHAAGRPASTLRNTALSFSAAWISRMLALSVSIVDEHALAPADAPRFLHRPRAPDPDRTALLPEQPLLVGRAADCAAVAVLKPTRPTCDNSSKAAGTSDRTSGGSRHTPWRGAPARPHHRPACQTPPCCQCRPWRLELPTH